MTDTWKMTVEIIIDGKIATPQQFGMLVYRIFERISPDGTFKMDRVILEPQVKSK